MLLLKVFWEFFKIGLFAVGGGPATIPFLFELSDKTGWFTNQELTNMIAVSESTPGPIGLNMATYVGFRTLGFFGGVVSTFGLVLPSIVVIILIAKFLANFSENKRVKRAFWGIRPAVTGLILSAVISMWRASLLIIKDTGYAPATGSIIVCLVTIVLMQVLQKKKFHPAVWLLGGAVVGLLFRL
ncbi:MAG: chromate transporter [Clostridiales bacterium]|nr:chromate transporter [Candidatus Blautia equi]